MVGRYAQNFNRNYASAWRSYKGMLICTAKIDLDDRMCNYMTASGRSSRPKVTSLLHEDEVPKALQVIVQLCKEANLKLPISSRSTAPKTCLKEVLPLSEFGIKILNIEASTVFEHNNGVRERYDYKEAMFVNSLLVITCWQTV